MKLFSAPLGAYETNCYLLWDGDDCAVIDPGEDGPALDDLLSRCPAAPRLVLLTHAHFDHVGGAEALRALGAAIWVHPAEAALPKTLAPLDLAGTEALSDGLEIPFGTDVIRVLHTPGHTPGSCCFRIGTRLFTGDTLFRDSCGRTDLGGSAAEMTASLRRLHDLTGDCAVLPGHGGQSTLARERENNYWMLQAVGP